MKTEYINPFLDAFSNVVKMTMNVNPEKKQLYIKEGSQRSGEVVISIGITGDLNGNFILNMKEDAAKNVASRMMMGMPVAELDDMAKSAIAELGNMVAGNAASNFSNTGLNIDITPPSMYTGKEMSIFSYKAKTICIPMSLESNVIEIDVALS